MRNRIKGILVFAFLIPFFCLKGQSEGVIYLNGPNYFIGISTIDKSLYEKNNVKSELISYKKKQSNKEFSFDIKINIDSIGNYDSITYYLKSEIVSNEKINQMSAKTFGEYYDSNNLKRKNKSKKNNIVENPKPFHENYKIERDSFGNEKLIYFPYPILEDTLKINYFYDYKLKTGKSTMYYNGIKYLRSNLKLDSNNRIVEENYLRLNYEQTSYLDLQKAEPSLFYTFDYYENGLLKYKSLNTFETRIELHYIYEFK